jgi:thiol:disulfide interchange protein
MKRLFLNPIFWIVALAVCAYFVNVQVQSYLGRQAWAATGLVSLPLDQALAKARAESKMVLVDVSAIWCPSCRLLDKTVFADARVKKVITEKYVFSRLEYESPEGRAFLKAHQLEGFPNLLLLDGNGVVVQHLEITFKPAEFLAQLGS